jgi:steroid delta-isomerase-like uncharacterized protein
MRKLSTLCLIAVCCTGLIAATAQKKRPSERKSTENNKAVARQVFDDLFSQGRYELINSMYEKNAVVHFGGRTASLDEAISEGKEWRSAFPDLVVKPDQVTEDGDTVMVRFSAHGTNKGKARGLPGKGKPARTQGSNKFKFNNGKIAEIWVDWNEDEVRRQVSGK